MEINFLYILSDIHFSEVFSHESQERNIFAFIFGL